MRALGTGLLLAIAAAILYGMQHSTPGYGDIISPVAIEGKARDRVEASGFAFGIAKVHLARTVQTESYGRLRDYTTSGVWLVLEGAGVAKKESLPLSSAAWVGPSGVTYALSQRFSSIRGFLGTERLEPGLPKPILIAFELPPDEVRGGRLLLSRSGLMPLEEELSIDVTEAMPQSVTPVLTILRGEGNAPWAIRID